MCRTPPFRLWVRVALNLVAQVKEYMKQIPGETHVTTATVRVAFVVAREKLQGRGYTTSILVLVSALVKLRTVSDLPPNRKVSSSNMYPKDGKVLGACHCLWQLPLSVLNSPLHPARTVWSLSFQL